MRCQPLNTCIESVQVFLWSLGIAESYVTCELRWRSKVRTSLEFQGLHRASEISLYLMRCAAKSDWSLR